MSKPTSIIVHYSTRVQSPGDGDYAMQQSDCTIEATLEDGDEVATEHALLAAKCEQAVRKHLGLHARTTASAHISPPPGELAQAVSLATLKATLLGYRSHYGKDAMDALLVKLFGCRPTWKDVEASQDMQQKLASELGLAS